MDTKGLRGVTASGRLGKPYRAQISTGGRITKLGLYATPEEAHAAYLRARSVAPVSSRGVQRRVMPEVLQMYPA